MRQYKLNNTEQYRFGYQGQFAEEDEETGWNQFELRMYDAEIGRWLVPDPMSQYWSPYMAMGNNPVSLVDPTGGWGDDPKLTKVEPLGLTDAPGLLDSETAFWGSLTEWTHGPLVVTADRIIANDYIGALGISSFYGQKIDYMETYSGVNYYTINKMQGGAMTIPPIGVIVNKSYYYNLTNDLERLKLKQHEFGHVLQYYQMGSITYYGLVSPLSLGSAGLDPNNHQRSWTEKDANTRADRFFGSKSVLGRSDYPVYQPMKSTSSFNGVVYLGYHRR